MAQLVRLHIAALLLSAAAAVRVAVREDCACDGGYDSAAALAQEELGPPRPWRSWVPPAPNAPWGPCGCGGGAAARLTDRETLRALSDAELTAAAGKLDKDIVQLKTSLADQKFKNQAALGKLQARLKKMQDGGKKLDTDAVTGADDRLADRTETSDGLAADEAKIEKITQGLTKAKADMDEARNAFEAIWAVQARCECKGGLPAGSLLSARQAITGPHSTASPPPTGAEHSKKVMKVQDLEQKRLAIKESIDKGVMKFSSDQRRLMDRMDDLGVTLNLKSRKAKASKRMDKDTEKILAHQVSAVKRYQENLNKQLTSRLMDISAMKKKTQDMREAIKRCGCPLK